MAADREGDKGEREREREKRVRVANGNAASREGGREGAAGTGADAVRGAQLGHSCAAAAASQGQRHVPMGNGGGHRAMHGGRGRR